jgi:ArsR family transcriptional regulator, arsenate/arsenite/antimonite-responsive transcriptional repressor / arsenate reductase (thioredoxin)
MKPEVSLARRVQIHGALADAHRLQIVDELVLSDRSPSELARALAIASNLLAHHLDVLAHSGVVERLPSAGDGRRRYVHLVPDAIAEIADPVAKLVARHILFVCSANSARSQMAAAVWNTRHGLPASSAGTRPAERVRPEAIHAAARAGLDLRGTRTRSVQEVTERPDLIVTVCDVAHEELRALPDDAIRLHWSIPDPAVRDAPSAYDDALARITSRVETLAPRVHPATRLGRGSSR